MLLKISTYTSPVLLSGNFLHRCHWCQPQMESASTGIKIFWLNAAFWRLNQAPLKHFITTISIVSVLPTAFLHPPWSVGGAVVSLLALLSHLARPIPLAQPSLPQAQRDCSHTAIIASSCITCTVAFSGERAGSKKLVFFCSVLTT